MKKIIAILLLTSAALSVHAVDVTVVSVSGSVEIKEPGGAWTPAAAGQVVSSRSLISTGFGSRARLDAGGMALNLQPLTRVSIDSLTEEGTGSTATTSTRVSLQTGRVRATRPPVTRATRRTIDFRVSTPVATAAVRGTDFELTVDKLTTYEGLVEFSQGDAFVLVPGGAGSWAVKGLRPVDPLELIEDLWGVSPEAGDILGADYGSRGGRRGRPSRNLGYARIDLD